MKGLIKSRPDPKASFNHGKNRKALNNNNLINWRSRIVSGNRPDKPKPMAELMDVSVIIRGNYTIITGKKKSRKSLLAAMLMSKIKGKLLIIDTEQSKYYTWLLRDRVKKLKEDNSQVVVLNLRGLSVSENRGIILRVLKEIKGIRALMIDNIRDLLHDINNPRESFEVVKFLEQITRKYNVGILGVIHSNKSNGVIRGHLGSELENRAYMIIKAERSRNNESNISCESSRDGDFRAFRLRHNLETGMPEIVGDIPLEEKRGLFREILNDSELGRQALIDAIINKFSTNSDRISERIAKKELNYALEHKWVIKIGKDRSPNVKYVLNGPLD